MEITKKANAKINLSLDLTSVLPNGYHAISTVMQSVTLHDTVRVRTGGEGVRLICADPAVPADGRNTAVKAALAFFEATGRAPGAEIEIEKRIPSQAGLGGGSADAAAALTALNELYGDLLPREKLLEICVKIGADVPFALLGGTRLCLNIGEVTAALPPVCAEVVIAKPARGVSTAEAYRRFDTGAGLSHPENDLVLYRLAQGETKQAMQSALNVFEQLTEIPEGGDIKRALLENGAYHAALSGSGSAYFGLFENERDAEHALAALKGLVPFAVRCRTAAAGVENA